MHKKLFYFRRELYQSAEYQAYINESILNGIVSPNTLMQVYKRKEELKKKIFNNQLPKELLYATAELPKPDNGIFTGINYPTGQPVFRNQNIFANGLFSGIPGTGKSLFLLMNHAIQYNKYGYINWIFTPNRNNIEALAVYLNGFLFEMQDLRINFWNPPKNIPSNVYADSMINIIRELKMGEGSAFITQEVWIELIKTKKSDEFISTSDIIKKLKERLSKAKSFRDKDWCATAIQRLIHIDNKFGKVFNVEHGFFDQIINKNCLFVFDDPNTTDTAIITAILLQRSMLSRKYKPREQRQIIAIDEAHVIFNQDVINSNTFREGQYILSRLYLEGRKYGINSLIYDQTPSGLDSTVEKNSDWKICLRSSIDEIKYMTEGVLEPETMKYISNLPDGIGIQRMPECRQYHIIILKKIFPPLLTEQQILKLKERNNNFKYKPLPERPISQISPISIEENKIKIEPPVNNKPENKKPERIITEFEDTLLRLLHSSGLEFTSLSDISNVLKKPASNLTYYIDKLQKNNFITKHKLYLNKHSFSIICEITKEGSEIIGRAKPTYNRGSSFRHAFIVNFCAKLANELRLQTYTDKKVLGVFADLAVITPIKDRKHIAFEAEKSTRTIRNNIEKDINAGYDLICIIPLSQSIQGRILNYCKKEFPALLKSGRVKIIFTSHITEFFNDLKEEINH